jgi:hypothetical protein
MYYSGRPTQLLFVWGLAAGRPVGRCGCRPRDTLGPDHEIHYYNLHDMGYSELLAVHKDPWTLVNTVCGARSLTTFGKPALWSPSHGIIIINAPVRCQRQPSRPTFPPCTPPLWPIPHERNLIQSDLWVTRTRHWPCRAQPIDRFIRILKRHFTKSLARTLSSITKTV